MKKILLSGFCLISIAVGSQNLFQDSFALYNPGLQLSGQGTWTNNSSLPGGLGAAVTGSGGSNAKVAANPVAYADYGTAGNSVEIKPDSDGCGTAFTSVTEGDIYVGFVINLSAAQANNNSDFFRVLSGGNFNTTFRIYAVNAGASFNIGISKGANGNPIALSTLSYGYNQDHLVIIKYSQFPGAGDDVASLYVDPVYAAGEPVTPSATTNTGSDQAGNIDRLAFRQNWTNGMPTGKAGLVSVARTWSDLAFPSLATTQFAATNTVFVGAENAKSGLLSLAATTASRSALLQIYTLSGVLVDEKRIAISGQVSDININPLQSAAYIVKITDDANKTHVRKIVVR